PRQAERAVRPGADAAPAELPARQRDAADQRPHGPDLAHRRRHPVLADRGVPGPARADDVQQLRPLQRRRRLVLRRPRAIARPGTTTTVPNMVTQTGDNAPAPWVPSTRAGCDFGAVAPANTVLENTGTGPSGDITKVFGAGSPQWNEAVASAAAPPGTAA